MCSFQEVNQALLGGQFGHDEQNNNDDNDYYDDIDDSGNNNNVNTKLDWQRRGNGSGIEYEYDENSLYKNLKIP